MKCVTVPAYCVELAFRLKKEGRRGKKKNNKQAVLLNLLRWRMKFGCTKAGRTVLERRELQTGRGKRRGKGRGARGREGEREACNIFRVVSLH